MARNQSLGNRIVKRRLNTTQIIFMLPPRKRPEVPSPQYQARQFVAVVLVLIALGSLLMLPISAESGESTGAVDALFTSVSAVAVTRLVVVDTQEHWISLGELVIINLI